MPSKRKAAKAGRVADDENTSNDGSAHAAPAPTTHAKRHRVSRACDQCRVAREKCDGIQPMCYPCVLANRSCTYDTSPKKRGVQTGYIRALELALACVFDKVPGSESVLHSVLAGDDREHERPPWATKRLHKKWRNSVVRMEIERMLSEGRTRGLQQDEKDSPSDDGGASETEGEGDKSGDAPQGRFGDRSRGREGPASEARSGLSPYGSAGLDTQSTPASRDNVQSPLSPTPFTRGGIVCGPRLQRLKLPLHHWRLLDIYFSYTHCWLPILDRQEVYQTSYLYSDPGGISLEADEPSAASHAELWAALALASYQDAAAPRPLAGSGPEPGVLTPSRMYEIARSIIPAENALYQLQHSRALLLLALVNMGQDNAMAASLLVSMATCIALRVGGAGSTVRTEARTTTLAACFVLDNIVSIRCNQHPYVRAEDLADGLPAFENHLDEWQPWTACPGFGDTASQDATRTSRSPAYAFSTLNQILGICKSVNQARSQRETDVLSSDGGRPSTPALAQLQQTINRRLPSAPFILSQDSAAALVPSPHIVKILMLWGSLVLDPAPSRPVPRLSRAIQQFCSNFGVCAVPPMLVTCLVSVTGISGSALLDQDEREDLASLQAALSAVWQRNGPIASAGAATASGIPGVGLARAGVHHFEDQPAAVTSGMGTVAALQLPTPSSFYDGLAAQTEASSMTENLYLSGANNPYSAAGYLNPRPLRSPTAARTEHSHPSHATGQVPQPAIDSSTVRPAGAHRYAVPYSQGFAGSSLDYDSLLDDLASIDYVDQVDTDPQFMANLGFAPGVDLSEILTQDFGPI